MAPLPVAESPLVFDVFSSSLELDRRFPSNLYPLATFKRSTSLTNPNTSKRASSLSPLQENAYLRTRDPAPPVSPNPPGSGTFDPHDINNRGIFALFALIAAGLVLASIWFFFWAKNGGFHFREGDWEDYKSTVLRRKGPDGKTLSNATKSTELGGGSVVADMAQEEEDDAVFIKKLHAHKARAPRGSKNNADNDVRAYRHEKPARVGGLNREADGSYHQDSVFSPTEPSEFSQPTVASIPPTPKKKPKKSNPFRTPVKKPSRDATTIETPDSTSSHRPLRPESTSASTTPTRSRQSSPRKHTSSRRQSRVPSQHSATISSASYANTYTEPLDFDTRYPPSEAAETDHSRGTKAYFHPIPGLSARSGDIGNGRFRGREVAGFRRGGGRGRRDSLSDSEGDETVRS